MGDGVAVEQINRIDGSGAIKAQYVMVDRLTSFMCTAPLLNNRPAMAQLARSLKVLKNPLTILINLHLHQRHELRMQPQFPFFRKIPGKGTIICTEEEKQDVLCVN